MKAHLKKSFLSLLFLSCISYASEHTAVAEPSKDKKECIFKTTERLNSLIKKYGNVQIVKGEHIKNCSFTYTYPIFKVHSEKYNKDGYYAVNPLKPGYFFFVGENQGFAHSVLAAFHGKNQ